MEKARKRRKTREPKKKPHKTIYTTLWVPLSQTFNTAANAPEPAKALQEQGSRSHRNKTAREKSLEFFLPTFPSTFPDVSQAPRRKRQLQRRPAAAASRPPTHQGHQPDSGTAVLTLNCRGETQDKSRANCTPPS